MTLSESDATSKAGSITSAKIIAHLYYEPAFQLGLDMLKKLRNYEELCQALAHEGQIMRALDSIQEYNTRGVKVTPFMEAIEKMKHDGEGPKADLALKRITEIRRVSPTLIFFKQIHSLQNVLIISLFVHKYKCNITF